MAPLSSRSGGGDDSHKRPCEDRSGRTVEEVVQVFEAPRRQMSANSQLSLIAALVPPDARTWTSGVTRFWQRSPKHPGRKVLVESGAGELGSRASGPPRDPFIGPNEFRSCGPGFHRFVGSDKPPRFGTAVQILARRSNYSESAARGGAWRRRAGSTREWTATRPLHRTQRIRILRAPGFHRFVGSDKGCYVNLGRKPNLEPQPGTNLTQEHIARGANSCDGTPGFSQPASILR